MRIDCFSFFNELDILELRLRELDDVVDVFVAVQGEETHAGVPKPMYLDPTAERWAPWAGRLRSVTVPRCTGAADRWVREREMRHVKKEALAPYADDDLVILACVDEIPDKRLFPRLDSQVVDPGWVGFLPPCYYYALNLRTARPLPAIQLAQVQTVRRFGADELERHYKHPPIGPVPGGWHFSYMGGVEAIQAKLRAFAHAEYDTEVYRDPVRLADRIAHHRDPFSDHRGTLTPVPISEMPEEVQRHPDRYAHLLLSGTVDAV